MRNPNLLRLLLLVLVLAKGTHANAAFHLWQINEVFSNADGSVQYIELTALAGGQQFVSGQTLRSSQSGSTKTFTFPSNLPGDSAGKTFLIGTQGFAALNLVTPDYTVPNGFLFTTNGTVNFADADTFTYATLPTNGSSSLARSGAIAAGTPRNFAGNTTTLTEIVDYSGAWNNAMESGWGLSVIRGASGAYGMVMYYFNTGRASTWYFMSGGTFSGTTYTAPITLFGGSGYHEPFSATPLTSAQVGTATINFTSASTATLTYTISGTQVTKNISKLQF